MIHRGHIELRYCPRRVGYVERDASFALPADIMEQSCQWAVEEKSSVTPLWDVVWNLNVEEGREKAMLQHPFTTDVEEMPPTSHIATDTTHVAESALKVFHPQIPHSL